MSEKLPNLTDAGTLDSEDLLYVVRNENTDLKASVQAVLDYVEANADLGDQLPPTATSGEMAAGTVTALRSVSPKLIADAIAAQAGSGGSAHSVRQITEVDGVWSATRDWNNPTLFVSTSDPAVLPPIHTVTGMRENLDRYERVGDPPVAVLVVNTQSNDPGDALMQQRLEGMGFTVNVQHQDVAPPADAAVCVISESIGSNNLHTGWDTSTIPVLQGEILAMDTLRLIDDDSSAHNGTALNGLSVTVGVSHPALGTLLPGLTQLYTSSSPYQRWLTSGLPPGGTTLMTAPNSSNAILTVYEAGSTLTTGTAPARRVAYGFMPSAAGGGPEKWTAGGWRLFDSLVYWLAGMSFG